MASLFPPSERHISNTNERKSLNFGLFYKHKSEKSHLVFLICKYCLINIQYICNVKKNNFKPKNIIKLSISICQIKKAPKNLKIGIGNLEIETKEENYKIADVKGIIPLF